MSLTFFDHVLVLVLVAWVPVQGALFYRRLDRAITAGDRDARMHAYGRTLIWEWGLASLLMLAWLMAGRSLGELGLTINLDWRMALGMSLSLAGCGFLIRQMPLLVDDPEACQGLRESLHHLRAIVPENRREMRRFTALSITAGICEELLYRGFLLWYLSQITTVWMAVLTSSFIFGTGHVYQGTNGMLRTGGFGAVAALLYVLTGSLLAPMLLHAVIDVTSGNVLRQVFYPRRGPDDGLDPGLS